jgi:hypothetical protein
MKSRVLIGLQLVLLGIAPGLPASAEPTNSNCVIKITYLFKSGTVKEKRFYSTTKNRAECAKAAELHKTNFASQQIAKKTVTFEWRKK